MGTTKENTKAQMEERLRSAADKGDLATLTRLLDEGVDKDAALDKTCMVHVGSSLSGYTVNRKGWTALMHAASNGNIDCIDCLVAKCANLEAANISGNTALIEAALYGMRTGNLDCLDHLIAKGANLDGQTKDEGPHCQRRGYGHTALILAAFHAMREGNLDYLKHLVAKGANLEAQDNDGWTALIHSAKGEPDCLDCLYFLVAKGANLEARNKDDGTALTEAAAYGYRGGKLDCVDRLVAMGAEINAQGKYKFSALHWAAAKGDALWVASLLKAGANMSLKDKDRDTALDLAKRSSKQSSKHAEVVELLEKLEKAAAQDIVNGIASGGHSVGHAQAGRRPDGGPGAHGPGGAPPANMEHKPVSAWFYETNVPVVREWWFEMVCCFCMPLASAVQGRA